MSETASPPSRAVREVFGKDNLDFYPTPKELFDKMWAKIPKEAKDRAHILEPSAGAGHILEYIQDKGRYGLYNGRFSLHAIEKDPQLVATLRGKGLDVIDYDFLSYSGMDKYDIIIGNPPFSDGDRHLLKAIEVIYSGHIVFLLNAETLRNPHTNLRKELVKKLDELGADIEYIAGAFAAAERKTNVDVALVYLCVERHVEEDLFNGIADAEDPDPGKAHEPNEIMAADSIDALVADYNRNIEICTRTLIDFYKNYRHVAPYLAVEVRNSDSRSKMIADVQHGPITPIMKDKLNELLAIMRTRYWDRALKLKKIQRRLTSKKRDEFFQRLKENSKMDFTAANIRQFILNLIENYEDMLTDAVLEVFEAMSCRYAWHEDLENSNIHYFNGWKTNKAYFVNSKVILRFWGEPFYDELFKRWRVNFQTADELADIDRVMNYFDGRSWYTSIHDALHHAFKAGADNRHIESTYFKISAFKKGTLHLTFKDEDIRRRFNVTACKGKNWLFKDYGNRAYRDLSREEKTVVNSFEDPMTYQSKVTESPQLFRVKDLLQLSQTAGRAE